MAGIRNHKAAMLLAAGALLLAGCMADGEPGPVAEQAFGLTETGTGTAPSCAGVGSSLSGSITLSAEDGTVWMIEDGRRLCSGSMAEVRQELLAYEARLQGQVRDPLDEQPSKRYLADGNDPHDIFSPTYDPNPVPAGATNDKLQTYYASSKSNSDEDEPAGPIPDPNPVPAIYIGVQLGSDDGASSSDGSGDEGGGPRFDLAVLTAPLR
jgi:hypothetical protein